jgi:hypothetical protein
MFLANSLKEKLKRDYIEGDTDSEGPLFRYEPPPKNPKILLSFKETNKSNQAIESPLLWNIPSHQLQSFDKKEWEKTFTLNRLHERWKEKGLIDFDYKFKKFPDNSAFKGVAEKKAYINNLRDPDILCLKPRKWNISTAAHEKYKPELKKVIFQEKHGLGEFMVVPLKIPNPPEGVDSRDKQEIDGCIWNVSNFVDKKEIEEKDDQELFMAKENSIKYWRKNEEDRFHQRPLPISNERKKIEVIRYYKKYRTPVQKSIDFENTMDKVKEATVFEKENVIKKVKKNNPGMERYPEKIDAIVFREMYNTYKDKYNEFIGNLPKEELKRRQMEKNKFRWNDKDLVNKITAINKFTNTGIFDDIPNNLTFEKNIKEADKSLKTDLSNKVPIDQSTKNTMRRSQSLNYSNSILLPLVIRGNEINKEEERIEEKLEEEYKKEQKRQLLLESKRFVKKKLENKFESRYPLTKEEYNSTKLATENQDLSGTLKKNKTFISANNINEEDIKAMNEISKSSECNTHFLEAYNKIAEKEYEKMVKNNRKENDMTYTYSHPGIYRTFNYVEKVTRIKRDITGEETTEIIPQKKEESFWSCCMNSDKNSKGCQRIASKKFKWNYY